MQLHVCPSSLSVGGGAQSACTAVEDFALLVGGWLAGWLAGCPDVGAPSSEQQRAQCCVP